ncbi:MAG TPA: hypothetical protein VF291_00825 [Burkholderiaceae bacterium]
MPLPVPPTVRRHRPAGPRCRGGASSLLRLAQPAASLAPWVVRAAGSAPIVAAVGAPAVAGPARASSIITRLLPSHELAGA